MDHYTSKVLKFLFTLIEELLQAAVLFAFIWFPNRLIGLDTPDLSMDSIVASFFGFGLFLIYGQAKAIAKSLDRRHEKMLKEQEKNKERADAQC